MNKHSERLKRAWITRRRNGNDAPWNKGIKGKQVAWNKGLTKEDCPILNRMGFIKGHEFYGDKEVLIKLSKERVGEKHPNWKGGITPVLLQIRHCFEYRQWRSDVFTRDGYTCQDCGDVGGKLEAHHIKEFSMIIHENNIMDLQDALECEELWNINNGKTLCRECHNKTPHFELTQYTA